MAPCLKKNWGVLWKIFFTCSKKRTILTRRVKKPLPIKLLKKWTWILMARWLKRNLSGPVLVKKPFQRCLRSKLSMSSYDKKEVWLSPIVDEYEKSQNYKTLDFISILLFTHDLITTPASARNNALSSLFRSLKNQKNYEKFYMCHVHYCTLLHEIYKKTYFDLLKKLVFWAKNLRIFCYYEHSVQNSSVYF